MHGSSRLPALPSEVGITPEVWFGIERMLFDYAELSPEDDVIVVYTPDVRVPAAWVCLALNLWGARFSVVPMGPLSDSGFDARLRAVVPKHRSRTGKCVVLVFEWETMSHNRVFREALHGHLPEQRRILRCINTGADLFSVGLLPHPEELSRKNSDLLAFLYGQRDVRVTTPSGTDLRISFDASAFAWISNRGLSENGRMIVLPAGEIATFPACIDGTLVADFAVNVNYRFNGDVRLTTNPVVVEIRDSRLVSFECSDERISSQLRMFFSMESAVRVGEVGFGTHPAVGSAVPENSHLNERKVGIHLGFGQHNQTNEAAGYIAQVHVDLIASGGTVFLPGGAVLNLDDVPSTNAPHPLLLESVDVFSPDIVPPDCCGISCSTNTENTTVS